MSNLVIDTLLIKILNQFKMFRPAMIGPEKQMGIKDRQIKCGRGCYSTSTLDDLTNTAVQMVLSRMEGAPEGIGNNPTR